MLTDARMRYAALTGVFILCMLGFRQIAGFVVAAGFLPWLALMGLIFWGAVALENRQRRLDGRPPYSLTEARELALPLGALAVVLLLAKLA